MRGYSQRVNFTRDFLIKAENAKEANEKLGELIQQAEWDANIEHDGYYDFEDEPVECKECKGVGMIGGDGDEPEKECVTCGGHGSIPFEG